ncbi:MAG TPA: AMP-binding protein [Rectinemataceae bacterium]|nr:AMP-binding protein [Rectinemataceae bacterium]
MDKPWLRFYGEVPHSLDYPDRTMYELLRDGGLRWPEGVAYDFMGRRGTYRRLLADIDRCAAALTARGLRAGDTVTVSLPNTPHALVFFYALNRIGVIASMIHPLSTATEIEFYLRESKSRWIVTLDAFYESAAAAASAAAVDTIVLASIGEFLPPLKRLGFWATSGRRIVRPPAGDRRVLRWKALMEPPPKAAAGAAAHNAAPRDATTHNAAAPGAEAPPKADDPAVILYSGGTTGSPKGIVLSSRNFNALGLQVGTQGPVLPGDTILSILPVFHGFGLGVCVHTFLIAGGTCVLVPRFTSASVAALIRAKRPQYMAGVPTLYESLAADPTMARTDLSCLKMIYAGGDKLPEPVKNRFDEFLRSRNGRTELFEGYGLTESVTACIVTPRGHYRPGSIGIPLPDMLAKIVAPGTTDELPPDSDGELCVAGPTLMLGYLNSPEESAHALRVHPDGRTWLHTGDLCSMDADGFVYFRLRIKRIIKVSGVSVSPVLVEETLDRHPDVALSCVVGVPDNRKLQAIKAFVVLKNPSAASEEKAAELIEYCRKHLIKWSVPESIEFRPSLPLTRVGKVAFSELEREHEARR